MRPTVYVVGSSGGIGQAVCEGLAASHFVLGIDRVNAVGTTSLGAFIRTAASTGEAVDELLDEIGRRYLTPNALVFAQGTYTRTTLENYTPEMLSGVLWDNFGLMFHIMRRLLPRMVVNGGGRIVVIASQAGISGGLDAAYAASKGAAVSFMKSIAREYGAHGIRFNAVSPGPVETAMAHAMGEDRKAYYRQAIPIGRLSDPAEVAALVDFLLTGPVDAINGATFDIDGGLVRR